MTQRRLPSSPIFLGALAVAALVLAASACSPDEAPRTSSTSGSTVSAPVPTSATAGQSPTTSAPVSTTASTARPAPVTITVLYDDHAAVSGTRAAHGFSCLIQGLEQTVLFDTGGDGDVLLSNMQVLGITPDDIDVVVLSHAHSDHTGGLTRLLESNPNVTVYYPVSFSESFARSLREAGASPAPVDAPVSPCKALFITAPSGDPAESGLLVDTTQGQVLVTGCAHPGIVEMARAASALVDEPVYAVMGGFHLMSHSADRVDRIIQELKQLGVERCGPAHCTGETAAAKMKAAFGAGAIEMGVGSTVTF